MRSKTPVLWAILFALMMCIVTSSYSKPTEYGDVLVSKLVDVHDGDTFFIEQPNWPPIIGHHIGVRVLGIDTPELHDKDLQVKAAAIKARAYARKVLESAKEIRLLNLKRDKYFRILADVSVDGKDFGKMMLDGGFAKKYDGGTKDVFTPEDVR